VAAKAGFSTAPNCPLADNWAALEMTKFLTACDNAHCGEMVVLRGKTPAEQLHELFVKVGSFYPRGKTSA
jgi:hypothetical protein